MRSNFPIALGLLFLCACQFGGGQLSKPLENIPAPEFAPYAMNAQIQSKQAAPAGVATEKSPALVAGQVILSPGLSKSGRPPQTLFLILRNPSGGPPIAAKKMTFETSPMAFVLTEANVMIPGTPIPEQFVLEARLDADGSAGKPQPGDWIGTSNGNIKKGDTKTVITIDQVI